MNILPQHQCNMNLPISLNIVASLFVLGGAQAAWHAIMPGHMVVNPSLLWFFAGIGLFLRRHLWRYIALACVWFSIIYLVIITAVMYAFPKNVTFNFLAAWSGLPLKVSSPTLGLMIMLPLFVWMIWVLSRKEVCELFSSRATNLAPESSAVDAASSAARPTPHVGGGSGHGR